MSKKITVLIGSPRIGGNTETLADAFIKGAQASGNTVNKIFLNQLEINGCHDCKYCTTHNGSCIQKDGMAEIYPLLYQTDVIVLASPIYFSGFSSHIKKVIDRMYVMTGRELPIKSSVLLSPYADTDTTVAEPIIAHYQAIARFMNWKDLGILTVPEMDGKGDILGHPCLKEAENLGRSIR